MGGPGTGTNPEQLFATGFAACFQGALGLAGKKAGVDTSASKVTAEVGFGPEGDSYAITVDLKVAVPGVDVAKVQEVADAAHQLCPYSKATRGNVPVTVTAVKAWVRTPSARPQRPGPAGPGLPSCLHRRSNAVPGRRCAPRCATIAAP